MCGALLGQPAAAQEATANESAPTRTQQEGLVLPSPVPQPPETARADRGGVVETLPDPATTEEVRGQYGWGLVWLIAGGLIVTLAIVSLFIFFMRRSWSSSPEKPFNAGSK